MRCSFFVMQLSRALNVAGLLAGLALFVGCLGSRPQSTPPPDERYGHRYEGEDEQGRRTIAITPPNPDRSYFYFPITVDSVHVRPAPFEDNRPAERQGVPVELLLKGTFSSSCVELHDVEQERAGNLISVDIQMRWPQGGVCRNVRRPYRFYMTLEGQYGVGNYRLNVNDRSYAFVIRRPTR